ncbi:MAG: TonB-dependent receptor [Opitutaceae bacterium]|nr:TonB-dependent receptor [Opitutaceae bacterium]
MSFSVLPLLIRLFPAFGVGLACAVLLPLPSLVAQTETAGTIAGRVVHAATGAYLEGVEISVLGTSIVTVTDRAGAFVLTRVPAGNRQIRAFYTGLEVDTQPVEVRAGRTQDVQLSLSARILQLEAMVVSSSRDGEAASITKQRNADNVVNVVSTDAFGSVADGNIGNFLVRIAGVSADYANGEVTGIKIRGAPAEFSSVNVDGVRAANANFDNPFGDRAAQIDTIPAEFIKEVEVTKAPTPDMPADSIGGAANLVTKSALDYKSDLLTYRVGANYNLFRKDTRRLTPNAAMTYLTRVGRDKQLGMTLSLSYTDTQAPRDRVQMTRAQDDGRNTQARTLTNVNNRERVGAGLKFDYRLTRSTSVFLKLNYNYYDFVSPRDVLQMIGSSRVADYSRVSRAQIEAGTAPRDATNAVAGSAPGYSDGYTEILHPTFLRSATSNLRTGRQAQVEIGSRSEFVGDQKLTFQASLNPTSFRGNLRSFDMNYGGPGFGLGIDTRENRSRPQFRQTYGPNIGFGSDFSLFTGRMVQTQQRVVDDIDNAKLDYTKDFKSARWPWQIKAGLAWREQYHSTRTATPAWTFVGSDRVAGRNASTGVNDDNLARFRTAEPVYTVFNRGGVWPSMDGIDFNRAFAAFTDQPELFLPEASVAAAPVLRKSTESVTGAYLQSKVQFGRLGVLGGVRMERTEVSAMGTYTDARNPGINRVDRSGSYEDLFPSLHLRYAFRPNLLARASYSTGAARPNFSDLYPTTTVSYSTATGLGTVTQNDPGLKPQYSDNYDLSLEYYLEPAGVVSVGAFRKDIRDFIARNSTDIGAGADNGFGGQYVGFILNTTTNLGRATIEGFELNYSQRLAWLPKPFNGLGLFGNLTRLETEGTYANGSGELVSFVPKSANAGASFRWRKLELRAAYNYTGTTLISYNVNVNSQQRNRPLETVDLNLEYTLRPQLKVFIDAINVKNKWPETYTALSPDRITIADSYGSRLNVGVSGRF